MTAKHELKLELAFTDRAGREVYNIKRGDDLLGSIRFREGTDVQHNDCWLEWATNKENAETP